MSMSEKLEAMLGSGRDDFLLRYGLGNAYLSEGNPEAAIAHLEIATQQNASHSAAWKLYAKALAETEQYGAARDAYQSGIEVAVQNGDRQAEKEMRVFLRRVEKQLNEGDQE